MIGVIVLLLRCLSGFSALKKIEGHGRTDDVVSITGSQPQERNLYSSSPERLFNLYCQALARSSFIVFSSQSREFRRDFVMNGLKVLFLLVISNFSLPNCIFIAKRWGLRFA